MRSSRADSRAARAGGLVLGILGSAVLACASPTVDGVAPDYDPTVLTGGVLYHWPVGREIAVLVLPAGEAPDLPASTRVAATRWRSALAYRELTFRIVDRIDEADIIVRDRAVPSPVDAADCGDVHPTGSPGSTVFCRSGSIAAVLPLVAGPPGRAKVLVTIDVAPLAGSGDLLAVTMHELGHAIGIGGHSPNADDVMFAAPTVTRPSRADARTLRYVLHRRPTLTL